MSDYKWTDREISENNFGLEYLEAVTFSHSLRNISSTNQRRDTIISFCNSEPKISNNTKDLVVAGASEAAAHLTTELEVPGTDSLHQNISKSLENNSRNGHSSSPHLDNLEYYRYRKRMGGNNFDNEDTFEDDLEKMMDVECKCNVKRIPGLDFMIIYLAKGRFQ